MTDTTYWIDGVALDDAKGRWFLGTGAPLSSIAAPALTSLRLPGREGLTYAGWSPYEETVLPIAVGFTNNTAAGAAGTYSDLVANVRQVAGLLHQRKTLTITRLQGGIRTTTTGRISASTEPVQLDERNASATFILTLAPPFWAEEATKTWAGAQAAPTLTTALTALAGSTAPIQHGVISSAGLHTALEIRDVATDRWLKVTTPVAAGQTLTLNLATLRAAVGSTDVSGAVDVGPNGFAPTPDAAGVVTLKFTRTGGNGLVSATGLRRSWL